RLERDAAAVRSRTRPQVSAFGTYAYGRPGLSLFTDDPHDWWLAGIRLQWAPWNWGTTARDVEVLRIRGLILDAQEEAFTDRLRRQVQQPIETMDRLRATIELDEQIIVLREQVERQARAQLEERAITAADYIEARTDLQEARVALL